MVLLRSTLWIGVLAGLAPWCGGAPAQEATASPTQEASGKTPDAGWTEFEKSADTRVIYVSSSTGSDAKSGLSEADAKRSIAAGKRLLRNGCPDWLLLKRGDAWDESLGNWGLSGRSEKERMLVSAYGEGTERPVLRTKTNDGFDAFPNVRNNHLALVGLRFWANTYNGKVHQPRGLFLLGEIENFLVEDCMIEGYETNLVVQGASEYPGPKGRHRNIAIRRCVVVDAYNTGTSNSEGIFASGTDGLLLEENVFDRNGWRDDVPGSEPTWFRHNIYIQNLNTDVVLRGNIVARTDGLHTRSGGLVEENLLLRNALNMVLGGGGFPAIEKDGVELTARRNVVLDGNDLQEGSPRGWGMHLSNLKQGLVDSNVIAHNTSGHAPFAVIFDVANNGKGVEKTVFSNNIVYDWGGPTRFSGPESGAVDVKVQKNVFLNEATKDALFEHMQTSGLRGVAFAENSFHSTADPGGWMKIESPLSLQQWREQAKDTTSVAKRPEFPDPSRTIGTYHASIGGTPTLDAFMLEARKQSRANWRPQYTAKAVNDYIRAGFGR